MSGLLVKPYCEPGFMSDSTFAWASAFECDAREKSSTVKQIIVLASAGSELVMTEEHSTAPPDFRRRSVLHHHHENRQDFWRSRRRDFLLRVERQAQSFISAKYLYRSLLLPPSQLSHNTDIRARHTTIAIRTDNWSQVYSSNQRPRRTGAMQVNLLPKADR